MWWTKGLKEAAALTLTLNRKRNTNPLILTLALT